MQFKNFSKAGLFSLGMLVAGTSALAASALLLFEDKGSASFKVYRNADGQTVSESVETRYFNLDYPYELLAKATVQSRQITAAEGLEGQVKLELFGNNRAKYDKVVWTATEKGSEVTFPGTGFIGIQEFGCCGSENVIRLFNVKTGKKVEAAIAQIFEIEVPNSQLPNRFLAQVVDSKAPAKRGSKSYLGTVSYFSTEKIISRTRVYADIPANWAAGMSELKLVATTSGGTQVVNPEGTRATLWTSDGIRNPEQAFRGVGLSGKIYFDGRSESFLLQVNRDGLDLAGSQSSSGLELVSVP